LCSKRIGGHKFDLSGSRDVIGLLIPSKPFPIVGGHLEPSLYP